MVAYTQVSPRSTSAGLRGLPLALRDVPHRGRYEMSFVLGMLCGGVIVFAGGYLWLYWYLNRTWT